jgi:excisionase family DNA binding protein
MDDTKYLTLEQVSKLLGVSKRTVMRQIKAGRLKAFKVGRSLRFEEEAIQEYIKHQQVTPGKLLEETLQTQHRAELTIAFRPRNTPSTP